MSKLRKSLALVGLAAAVIVALAVALWPRSVLVDAVPVTRGPLRVTVDEEGKSRIKDVYVVSAPASGRVLRSSLEAGDMVRKDETIVAVIEPGAPPFLDLRGRRELEALIEAARAAVALARAEVAQARSELEFALRELQRANSLARTQIIPERTLEKARLDADTRQAALARAEANQELRQRELESAIARRTGPDDPDVFSESASCCVTVRAPVSGRVLKIVQESEQVVAQGSPLLEVGNPENLELVVELLSADAVKVQPGAAASVEGWGGPPLVAKVERVEPAGFTKVSALGIEEQRVRVVLSIAASPDKHHRLGHDYRVLVRITVHESADALLVPLGALFRHGKAWAVFVVAGGRARLKTVDIGQRSETDAEVGKGLAVGERVIQHPGDRIADGVRVAERASSSLRGD